MHVKLNCSECSSSISHLCSLKKNRKKNLILMSLKRLKKKKKKKIDCHWLHNLKMNVKCRIIKGFKIETEWVFFKVCSSIMKQFPSICGNFLLKLMKWNEWDEGSNKILLRVQKNHLCTQFCSHSDSYCKNSIEEICLVMLSCFLHVWTIKPPRKKEKLNSRKLERNMKHLLQNILS
jgi:small-conductance mechanosensitive channel